MALDDKDLRHVDEICQVASLLDKLNRTVMSYAQGLISSIGQLNEKVQDRLASEENGGMLSVDDCFSLFDEFLQNSRKAEAYSHEVVGYMKELCCQIDEIIQQSDNKELLEKIYGEGLAWANSMFESLNDLTGSSNEEKLSFFELAFAAEQMQKRGRPPAESGARPRFE